ncbi:AtuA-related protein [Pseudoroseicyclus tamaricis]|uniref:AtuA-like ferredoxin-fold domain-containing protein n=1 Tax=Pseudoroseicyclus tamaricis TaxID=2705421 RepID=A0A6B2JG02_9RHOB|nr:hypothetical protein [Pseudoroseicyclus tamaricis]NDV00033.1 hypothetical protein [Pseudoroseicyclus tamaricis]
MSVRVPLHRLAHGRTGDKGNRLNVSVIAYDAADWNTLTEQVTEARILALFRHRGASSATRYLLPHLAAMNFVIEDALEGGVNSALAVDTHGKTLSFHVLGMAVEISAARAAELGLEETGPTKRYQEETTT